MPGKKGSGNDQCCHRNTLASKHDSMMLTQALLLQVVQRCYPEGHVGAGMRMGWLQMIQQVCQLDSHSMALYMFMPKTGPARAVETGREQRTPQATHTWAYPPTATPSCDTATKRASDGQNHTRKCNVHQLGAHSNPPVHLCAPHNHGYWSH
jgi:hypothetical protein